MQKAKGQGHRALGEADQKRNLAFLDEKSGGLRRAVQSVPYPPTGKASRPWLWVAQQHGVGSYHQHQHRLKAPVQVCAGLGRPTRGSQQKWWWSKTSIQLRVHDLKSSPSHPMDLACISREKHKYSGRCRGMILY